MYGCVTLHNESKAAAATSWRVFFLISSRVLLFLLVVAGLLCVFGFVCLCVLCVLFVCLFVFGVYVSSDSNHFYI